MSITISPKFILFYLLAVSLAGASFSDRATASESTPQPVIQSFRNHFPLLNSVTQLTSNGVAIAVGTGGTILRTDDNGQRWHIINSPSTTLLHGVRFVGASNTVIAVGGKGTIIRSEDAGVTWTPVPSGTQTEIHSLSVSDDGTSILLVGDQGLILRSNDLGKSWTREFNESKDNLYCVVHAPSSTSAVAVGASGVVLLSKKNGEFRPLDPIGKLTLWGCHLSQDENTIFASATSGLVASSRDGGANWSTQEVKKGTPIRAILGDPKKMLYLVGDRGSAFRSDDNGQSWISLPTNTDQKLTDIQYSASHEFITVGSNGFIALGPPGGWTTRALPSSLLWSATSLRDGGAVVVGADGLVLRRDGWRSKWAAVNSNTDQVLKTIISLRRSGRLIAAGGTGVIIISDDLGKSWRPVSLNVTENREFYALAEITSTEEIAAVGQKGMVYLSKNGGDSWTPVTVDTEVSLNAVTEITDGTGVIAVGNEGVVIKRATANDEWSLSEVGGNDLYGIAPLKERNSLFMVDRYGGGYKSNSNGEKWTQISTLASKGAFNIITSDDRSIIYVMGEEGLILRSDDNGKNWIPQLTPDARRRIDLYYGVAWNENSSLFVGESIIESLQDLRKMPPPSSYHYTQTGDELILTWTHSSNTAIYCDSVYYGINDELDRFRATNAVMKKAVDNGIVSISAHWNPAKEHLAVGTKIRYAVQCRDSELNISWTQEMPGEQRFGSIYEKAMEFYKTISELPDTVRVIISVVLITVIWFLVLVALLLLAPIYILQIRETVVEIATDNTEAQKGLEKLVSFAGGTIAKLFAVLLLDWFAARTRVLDAWGERVKQSVNERFVSSESRTIYDRRIVIELPLAVNDSVLDNPWNQIRSIFLRGPTIIFIKGAGGSGKTTIACSIARRAMREEGIPPLTNKILLPIFIQEDIPSSAQTLTGFTNYIVQHLRTLVSIGRPVSELLTKSLIRSGRVLIIIDGLSERDKSTKDFIKSLHTLFPRTFIMITSRDDAMWGSAVRLEQKEIPPGSLFDFLKRYSSIQMKEKGGSDPRDIDVMEAQLRLKHILDDRPVSPMLAEMWAREMIDSNGGMNAVAGVAEIMDRYVRRIITEAAGSEIIAQAVTKSLLAIAIAELGEELTPGLISRDTVYEIVKKAANNDSERAMEILLSSGLLEAPSKESNHLRINPDPLAEHLAARSLVEKFGPDEAKWNNWLKAMEDMDTPIGYLEALADCLRHPGYGRSIPTIVIESISQQYTAATISSSIPVY